MPLEPCIKPREYGEIVLIAEKMLTSQCVHDRDPTLKLSFVKKFIDKLFERCEGLNLPPHLTSADLAQLLRVKHVTAALLSRRLKGHGKENRSVWTTATSRFARYLCFLGKAFLQYFGTRNSAELVADVRSLGLQGVSDVEHDGLLLAGLSSVWMFFNRAITAAEKGEKSDLYCFIRTVVQLQYPEESTGLSTQTVKAYVALENTDVITTEDRRIEVKQRIATCACAETDVFDPSEWTPRCLRDVITSFRGYVESCQEEFTCRGKRSAIALNSHQVDDFIPIRGFLNLGELHEYVSASPIRYTTLSALAYVIVAHQGGSHEHVKELIHGKDKRPRQFVLDSIYARGNFKHVFFVVCQNTNFTDPLPLWEYAQQIDPLRSAPDSAGADYKPSLQSWEVAELCALLTLIARTWVLVPISRELNALLRNQSN